MLHGMRGTRRAGLAMPEAFGEGPRAPAKEARVEAALPRHAVLQAAGRGGTGEKVNREGAAVMPQRLPAVARLARICGNWLGLRLGVQEVRSALISCGFAEVFRMVPPP